MIRYFIGANNETGEVDIKAIRYIFDAHFTCYSIIDSLGRWEGKNENSVIVEVQPESEQTYSDFEIHRLCKILKARLQQDAIGYQILPKLIII